MKLLQNGCPKSGNYWLYTILSAVLDGAKVPRKSVIQNHPINAVAKTWTLSYPEQCELDVLDIESKRQFMRIGLFFKEPIPDLDAYIDGNRLVWTHARFIQDSAEIYNKFDKVVYIIRDPRDVAISMAHFSFTPYRLNAHHNPFKNAQEYLEQNLIKHVTGWCQHVGSHLLSENRETMHIIFYENLKENFAEELDRLVDFLELPLTAEDKAEVARLSSVDQMRKKSKGHVRQGSSGGWRKNLSPKQIKRCNLVAGPMLKTLGYATSADQQSVLKMPEVLPKKNIRSSMKRSLIARGIWMIRSNRKNLSRPDNADFGSSVKKG